MSTTSEAAEAERKREYERNRRDLQLALFNPNSTIGVGADLYHAINDDRYRPAGVHLDCFTGPEDAPDSIHDDLTACQSAVACAELFKDDVALQSVDGILVCCFSDHPLVPILQKIAPNKTILGMFESAISTSLLLGGRFGVLTTGQAMVPGIVKGINAFGSSTRCSGVYATDLGVAELHDSRGANRSKVERVMKETAAKMVREGADVIILGCAGMVGMEKLVKDGVKEAGLEKQIWVVDGAKSGIELLAALIRVKRQA